MISDILDQARESLKKSLQVVGDDLGTISVDQARPALVEKIRVSAYEGAVLEIRELANIIIPHPQQIIISPWDKSIIKKIAQAINDSDLNLNPIVEKEMIRIRVPPLTEERREAMRKLVQMKLESGRKIIRNIRNEAKSEIEALEGEDGVSEDDVFRGVDDLQTLHDEFIEKMEKLAAERLKGLNL